MKTIARVSAASLLVLNLFAGPAIAADANAERQQAESRLASVKAMSEALQREAAKAGVDHKALLDRVAGRTREAEALMSAGKAGTAKPMLDDSYRELTQAIAGIKRPASAAATPAEPKAADLKLRERVERNLATTATMLDAFKRQNDEKHGGKAAEIAAIEQVRGNAFDALKAGELPKAESLVNEAYVRIKAGIASLQPASDLKSGSAALDASRREPGAAVSAAARDNFNRRRDSTQALVATGQRIAAEKKATRTEFASAEALLREADNLATAGRHAEGLAQVDKAYVLARDAIRALRGGEEVRADKNFASKADEYRYEQARNDDYQGLIAGVVKGKSEAAWGRAAEQAKAQRADADKAAKSGDWDAALKKIDESTKTLKGVLRDAGFPIV